MKTFLSKIAILAALTFIVGCSDTETFVDEVFDNTTRGTVLKTVENSANLEFVVGGESLVTFGVEVIDQRDQDFDRIDIYMSFFDNQTESDDPDNNSKDEELLRSFPKGSLNMNGEYPVLNFELTLQEVEDFFNLTDDDYTGGDRINLRLELIMNDGRVFTSTNLNNVVSGGAFYRSPFQYNVNFVCPADVPSFGTWTVDMQDSWGDGWNGGTLLVTLDGDTEIVLEFLDGATKTETFEVPSSTETISIVYTGGSFDEEVTFQITAPNGNQVVDQGVNPPVDIELIDYCDRSYQD